MKLLYIEPEIDKHWFAIYHLHYKKKPGIIESAYNPRLLQPLLKLLSPLGALFDCYN